MATVTLKEGDFGSDVTVTVGETTLYLPDRARPGLNEAVPLTAIAEIELLSDDRSGQLKAAARFGVRGFLNTGNPLGLAAGVFAVTKVKDVNFAVRLKDGRRFVAVTDARTYAEIGAAWRTPATADGEDAAAAARADAVIAKYLGPDAVPLAPEPEPPAPAAAAEPPGEPSRADPPARPARPPRRVFGRRGLG